MNEHLIAALSSGIALGIFFFGGLWWTVKKGLTSARPALWFIGSLLLRSAVTLCGFYFVANGDWRRIAACLSGFVISRVIAIRLPRGESHAP